MDENRRSFLKKAGCVAMGASCGFPLLGGCDFSKHDPGSSQWAMILDVQKCQQQKVRDACISVCHRAHNVPEVSDAEEEVKWIWNSDYEHAFPDQVHAQTGSAMKTLPILVLCNHCTKPSCVRVCPTGATWKRESDGLVMMDMHRCIGCRYCMAACPYGSRSFNWSDPRQQVARDEQGEFLSDYPTRSKGVVEKCTFCAERIRTGEEPLCVEAANQIEDGAITFGKLSDPNVRRILDEERTICRRAGLGAGPNVFYIV